MTTLVPNSEEDEEDCDCDCGVSFLFARAPCVLCRCVPSCFKRGLFNGYSFFHNSTTPHHHTPVHTRLSMQVKKGRVGRICLPDLASLCVHSPPTPPPP